MLQSIGRSCKRYLEEVKKNRKQAVARRPCPYEDCRCAKVWFWGWHERKEGSIPLDVDEVCGPIPLRRFWCTQCARTFSWRPPFLVFARRLAANAYQQCLKNWALGRRGSSSEWHELSSSGRKSFLARVSRVGRALLQRLSPGLLCEPDRRRIWFILRCTAARLRRNDSFRQPIHVLSLSLARHPDGTCYLLSSA